MFDAGLLGSTYRRGRLLELVSALFPEIGNQENAVGPFERRFESFRAVQIRCDDFFGELAMLARITGQSANFELLTGLQGVYNPAPLLPGCAESPR